MGKTRWRLKGLICAFAVFGLAGAVLAPATSSSVIETTQSTSSSFRVADARSIDDILESLDYDPIEHGAILRLYQGIFGRYPDVKGAKYWIGVNKAGSGVLDIAGFMSGSVEWANNYQGTNDQQFLTKVYENVLGRDYDQGGFNYWLDTLQGTNLTGSNPTNAQIARHELVFYVTANQEFVNAYPFPATDDDTVPLTESGGLLKVVQDRGFLRCGVSGAQVGFSETMPDGSIIGFDADMCRAVAAAVLGDANAVRFESLTAAERFIAIQSGDVDVLMRNTTWTQSRDTDIGVDFGPVTYHDGIQFLGRATDGFTRNSKVASIDGAVVCVAASTSVERIVAQEALKTGISISLVTLARFTDVMSAFENGQCDVIASYGSNLITFKALDEPWDVANPDHHEWSIFPPRPLTKEPYAPAYLENDSQWADAVNWTIYAMIIADEKGATQANLIDFLVSDDADLEILRLMGLEDAFSQESMGLQTDAFYQVISQVGNYEDVFNRNFNRLDTFRENGPNAPWDEGGTIFAPPAR